MFHTHSSHIIIAEKKQNLFFFDQKSLILDCLNLLSSVCRTSCLIVKSMRRQSGFGIVLFDPMIDSQVLARLKAIGDRKSNTASLPKKAESCGT
jgi:hypothetical protein